MDSLSKIEDLMMTFELSNLHLAQALCMAEDFDFVRVFTDLFEPIILERYRFSDKVLDETEIFEFAEDLFEDGYLVSNCNSLKNTFGIARSLKSCHLAFCYTDLSVSSLFDFYYYKDWCEKVKDDDILIVKSRYSKPKFVRNHKFFKKYREKYETLSK